MYVQDSMYNVHSTVPCEIDGPQEEIFNMRHISESLYGRRPYL
jgi:hypothetical protein